VKSPVKFLGAVLTAVALCLPAAAGADMLTITPGSFATTLSSNQAGAHADLTTTFAIEADTERNPFGGSARNLAVELPPGMEGAANAVPTCPMNLVAQPQGSPQCPNKSAVGEVLAFVTTPGGTGVLQFRTLVFSVTPSPGEPAALGFNALYPVRLDAKLRSDGDYGLTASATNLTEAGSVLGATMTLWGVPADHSGPGPKFTSIGTSYGGPNTEEGVERRPFLTNPTQCSNPSLGSFLAVDSWLHPGALKPDGTPDLSAPGWATAVYDVGGFEECEELEFQPSLEARPTTNAADSPSGLDVDLKIPQNSDPDGLMSAQLRDAQVILPEGLVLNPSSANGLGACDLSQIGYQGRGAEQQTLSYDLSRAGSFTVTYAGGQTAPIPARASGIEVRQAIETLPGLAANVAVSGGPGAWIVAFTGALQGSDVAELSGTVTASPVQRVDVTGEAGGFNLHIGSEDTAGSFEATFSAGATMIKFKSTTVPLFEGTPIEGPGIAPGTRVSFTSENQAFLNQPTTSEQTDAMIETEVVVGLEGRWLRESLRMIDAFGEGGVYDAGTVGSTHSYEVVFNSAPPGADPALLTQTNTLSGPGAGVVVTKVPSSGSSPLTVSTTTESGKPQFSLDKPACPDASRLGSAEIITPLLDDPPLQGSIYLATPHQNPFGSLLAIYLVVEGHGIIAKIPGKVTPDPQTGRLSASFEENPQVSIEDVKLKFDAGAYAPLRTPSTCGKYATTSSLTPWSAPFTGPPATPKDEYEITQGPGGQPCGAQANSPSFEAGSVAPLAGQYKPFVVNLRREDGTQQFSAVTLTPPPGLVAKLAGTQTCSDAALAAAAGKTGKQEQSSPSCPAASEVGSVFASAGAGPAPYNAPGKAYLTGPYKGAPLSLAILTPAVAGPFDLGTIVVRTALYLDSKTAQVTAKSDPIPTILQGIPLDIRSVSIRLDKPGFTLNPTSCDPTSVGGSLLSTTGASAALSSRFQLAECDQLKFKPSLKLTLKGPTKRAKYPALTAVLRNRPGDANIASVQVALPHSEFLAQEHIGTVCTRVQWAADACPKASIYGKVRVDTPLLDYPLTGNVYLRSSDNPLPDLVPDLRGPANQPIRFEAAGKTDSVNGGIRNTFSLVPDVPFTKLTLQLQGGKKGLLVNSRDICKSTTKADVYYTAHNGASYSIRPVLKATGCGSKAKKKSEGQGGQRR
jgi:hypothetical protein